jgi:hypothetical protein
MNTFYIVTVVFFALGMPACSSLRIAQVSLRDGSEWKMKNDLSRVNAHLEEFEKKNNIDDLQEAADILASVSTTFERYFRTEPKERGEILASWLRIINLIDNNLDPAFDPADVPAISVLPPGQAGLQYGSGTKPEDIKDPELKKQFEAALEENRRKSEAYAFQTGMRRLNGSVTPNVISFLRQCYASTQKDRESCEAALMSVIKNPKRAAALREELLRASN